MALTTRPCPWGCGTPLTFLPEPSGAAGRCPGCRQRCAAQGDWLTRVQPTRLERIVYELRAALRSIDQLLARLTLPRAAPAPAAAPPTPALARPGPGDRRPERSPATQRY